MQRFFQPPLAPRWVSAIAACIAPAIAHAHVGAGSTSGFSQGLAHPVLGFDHFAAMVAVGLWAAQRGDRAIWVVPLAFISAMTVGGVFGALSGPMEFVETANVASVLVLGVLITAAVRLPLAASSSLVTLFAVFHGHAHGSEMPQAASGAAYGLGFELGTAALLACGIGISLLAEQLARPGLVRYTGGVITVLGIGIFLA